MRYFRLISALLWEVDTITIRLVMGVASLIFAVFMVLSHQSLAPAAYDLMEWVGPRWVWAIIFMAYGASTTWLVWDDVKNGVKRAEYNLWTNIYGFVVWSFTLVSVCVSVGYLPPLMALYFVTVPFLGWAIVRTAPPRRVR